MDDGDVNSWIASSGASDEVWLGCLSWESRDRFIGIINLLAGDWTISRLFAPRELTLVTIPPGRLLLSGPDNHVAPTLKHLGQFGSGAAIIWPLPSSQYIQDHEPLPNILDNLYSNGLNVPRPSGVQG